MTRRLGTHVLAAACALATIGAPARVRAFCGFYVAGGDAKLFADASQVVLMRDGTRTVLSMQNHYKGPPENFALVVPVPVVLQKENVKTLPDELFARVDTLTAPRLVEYWERDPCPSTDDDDDKAPKKGRGKKGKHSGRARGPAAAEDRGVEVEAEFKVGEYEIVVLSAKDAGGLEAWLHDEKYAIPAGAEPYFRPYVASGSKFFVARVDVKKVKMVDGRAALSPLRFHYDTPELSLPVRLGLINSNGTQDLIVNVLAPRKRFEPANYPTVTIPTNLDVNEDARGQFGSFYASLFDLTLERNPGAIVTEYAWDASTCDPCPGPALSQNDFELLGADTLADPGGRKVLRVENAVAPWGEAPQPVGRSRRRGSRLDGLARCFSPEGGEEPTAYVGEHIELQVAWKDHRVSPGSVAKDLASRPKAASCMERDLKYFWVQSPDGEGTLAFDVVAKPAPVWRDWTITRLHARYSKSSLGRDIVFKEAAPITGGREQRDGKGALEEGAVPSNFNNFQGRYAIRHPWKEPVQCENPRYGIWGGPPRGGSQRPVAANDIAFVKRGAAFASFVDRRPGANVPADLLDAGTRPAGSGAPVPPPRRGVAAGPVGWMPRLLRIVRRRVRRELHRPRRARVRPHAGAPATRVSSVRGNIALALLMAAACGSEVEPAASSRPFAVLPTGPAGPMAPSLARVVGSPPPAELGARLSDVDTCGSCHVDVAAQWRRSAHAFASFNNPIYRVVVDRFRAARGNRTSQFCGGCHDVALLVGGSMLGAIEPTDLRAHAGITCATCHSIAAARPDGNGSWDLDPSPVPLPKDGDADSVVRHRMRVGGAALRTAAMCTTCHKAFLDHDTGNPAHLVGQDDATPWARSAFAGSLAGFLDDDLPAKDCRRCHMPRVPAPNGDPGAKQGTVASHLFLGGHTWLASMQGDPDLQSAAREFLRDRVSIDIGGLRHEDGTHAIVAALPITVSPGERVVLDVVVRNLDVGHRFPGGVMDVQDTWIEVLVEDALGRPLAEAGTEHELSGTDPTAHVLASYLADADGNRLVLRETQDFRASVYNHTIAPRDAAVVGYSFAAPSGTGSYPLTVSARLRHRSRRLELQRAACEDSSSERGRRFGEVGLAKVSRAIDACAPQPVIDVAHVTVRIASPDDVTPAREPESTSVAFARRFAYGLGLSHAVQERLDDARLPLREASAIADTPRRRAMVFGLLALLAAQERRTDETFAWAEKADDALATAGMPRAPSMQRVRAEVLAATWELANAAPIALEAAELAPHDDSAWATAAVTLVGDGDMAGALRAARRGLAIQPRDGDLLRAQALALKALSVDRAAVAGAEEAFLDRRTPDEAPGIRARCSAHVAGCSNERIPVHVHAMRQR